MGEKTNSIEGTDDPLPVTRPPHRDPDDCRVLVSLRTIDYETIGVDQPAMWRFEVTVNGDTWKETRELQASGHYGNDRQHFWDKTTPKGCRTSIPIAFEVRAFLVHGFSAPERYDVPGSMISELHLEGRVSKSGSYECPSLTDVVLDLDVVEKRLHAKEDVTQARLKFPFKIALTCGQ